MNEMPESLRPYEKCKKYGAEVLDDSELLSVILRSGTVDKNALELSRTLLHRFGGTLNGVLRGSRNEFLELKGIGDVKATLLECLRVLVSRAHKSECGFRPQFSNPTVISDYYMDEMRYFDQEVLRVLYLDSKMKLIRDVDISKGTVNSSCVPVREIFVKAMELNAVSLVLLHNHPSGDPEPSKDDITSTECVSEAGKTVGIYLIDHLIIGDGRYVSLRDRGLIHDL